MPDHEDDDIKTGRPAIDRNGTITRNVRFNRRQIEMMEAFCKSREMSFGAAIRYIMDHYFDPWSF
jgi:hypothetical protein